MPEQPPRSARRAARGYSGNVLPVGLPVQYVADSLAARTDAHILRPVSPSRLSPWERQGGGTLCGPRSCIRGSSLAAPAAPAPLRVLRGRTTWRGSRSSRTAERGGLG